MRRELLPYLCSPTTQRPLRLIAEESEGDDVVTGKLIADGTGEEYPVIKGIPRFIQTEKVYSNYTTSFGHQWNHYNWLRDEDLTEFEAIVDRPISSFRGLTILDAGCGGGRVARFLSPLARLYIGVDYSHAPERARELCRNVPHAHFIQADVNRLPFPRAPLFDFAFSHGVLHHSPDTRQSFSNLPPLVKPGGELYIAVFRKAFAGLRISDSLIRYMVSRLPLPLQERFCRVLVGLRRLPAAAFWKRFFWFSLQQDAEVALFCNYDWYAPRYHHEHTAVEVMNWFAAEGFKEIQHINAWPYCPPEEKFAIPTFGNSFRLGQLVGVLGRKKQEAMSSHARHFRAA